MATSKAKKTAKPGEFQEVSGDLNIWNRDWQKAKKGASIVGLVTLVDPNATIGDQNKPTLRVEIEAPDGEAWTLPAHAVLVGRLKRVPGGCIPYLTVLRVTYEGTEKSKFKTPMQMYRLEFRNREADDLWNYPMPTAAGDKF